MLAYNIPTFLAICHFPTLIYFYSAVLASFLFLLGFWFVVVCCFVLWSKYKNPLSRPLNLLFFFDGFIPTYMIRSFFSLKSQFVESLLYIGAVRTIWMM